MTAKILLDSCQKTGGKSSQRHLNYDNLPLEHTLEHSLPSRDCYKIDSTVVKLWLLGWLVSNGTKNFNFEIWELDVKCCGTLPFDTNYIAARSSRVTSLTVSYAIWDDVVTNLQRGNFYGVYINAWLLIHVKSYWHDFLTCIIPTILTRRLF